MESGDLSLPLGEDNEGFRNFVLDLAYEPIGDGRYAPGFIFKMIRMNSISDFSSHERLKLADTMQYEFMSLKTRGLLPANPWKTIITNVQQSFYSDYSLEALWIVWCQMILSAYNGTTFADYRVRSLLLQNGNFFNNMHLMDPRGPPEMERSPYTTYAHPRFLP